MASPDFAKLEIEPFEVRDGASLNTSSLETQMMDHNGGFNLRQVTERTRIDFNKHLEFVPFFERTNLDDDTAMRLTEGLFGHYSLSISDIQGLYRMMSEAYQVAHHTYILGRKTNMKGTFPFNCCGPSSRAIMLSLLDFGYPNAAYAYSDTFDHGYVVLPFVLGSGDDAFRGSVVVDPTFDQLWDTSRTRNAVFIKEGQRWRYKTQFKGCADLFPTKVRSLGNVKIHPSCHPLDFSRGYHHGGESYFEAAFDNRVRLKKGK